MAVALVGALGVEEPDPRRQLRWDVEDHFARGDELLGQQGAGAVGPLHRPDVRLEALGEGEQAIALGSIRLYTQLVDDHLVAVEHRGVV